MIEVCVGLIATGKSTYCRQRALEGWVVVNDDNIVNLIHSNQYTLYKERLKPLYKSVGNHIVYIAVGMGLNVVIDRGLDVSKEARKRWVSIAHSLDIDINAVVFPYPLLEECAKRRFESDNRGYDYDTWLQIVKRHWANYDTPKIDEGFTKVIQRSF